jgi:hypothetical protein
MGRYETCPGVIIEPCQWHYVLQILFVVSLGADGNYFLVDIEPFPLVIIPRWQIIFPSA